MKLPFLSLISSVALCGSVHAQREPIPSDPPESVKAGLDLSHGKTAEQDLKLDLYLEASPITHFTKETGPVLFLTGDLDHPERDASGLEKLEGLGVPAKQVVLADGKHGCWMQRPWFGQCVDAVDAWFQEHLK